MSGNVDLLDMLISKGCDVQAKNKEVISNVKASLFTGNFFAVGSRPFGNFYFKWPSENGKETS